jgi:TP901 family phage tail tape measure protein
MGTAKTSWILELVDKISAPFKSVKKETDEAGESFKKTSEKAKAFWESLKNIKPMDWQATKMGLQTLGNWFDDINAKGADFDAALREVSAITDVTGKDLDNLGAKAKELSTAFGSSATDNLKTFQTILSRLGPQIGESATALSDMGKYANTLSKTMGGDVVGATDALTTSLLQFRVDLNDPIGAAKEMERMMNVMAAGAKEGAAEVPQIGEALKQAGVAAKLANVSFEEANAAIQTMAAGGKFGSEAGVAIRNVITSMSATSKLNKKSVEALSSYKIKLSEISDATVPFSERLKKLSPIQDDINALTLMFGRENAAAAQILISTADNQQELTDAITGTNTAYVQSETIMGGWTEKISRAKAWIDNLKIGCFDFTKVAGLMVGGITGSLAVLADFSTIYTGLWPVIKSATLAIKGWSIWSGIATVATSAWTAVQWLLNAAFIASPIGWIVVGIGALVAVVVVCWKKFEGFRAFLYGMWEVIKGFGNLIKEFIVDRIVGFIKGIGALGEALLKLFKGDFKGAFQSAKDGVSGIFGIEATKNAYENAKGLGSAFQKGFEDGKEAFQIEKENKASEGTDTWTKIGGFNSIGAKSVVNGENTNNNSKKTGSGNNETDGSNTISGTGGSGKSITMNVTLNITNNGIKNPDDFTEQVVRKINDRLNDALAIAG